MDSQRGDCMFQSKIFLWVCVSTCVSVNMQAHTLKYTVLMYLYSLVDTFINNSPLSCIIGVLCGLVSVEVPKVGVIPQQWPKESYFICFLPQQIMLFISVVVIPLSSFVHQFCEQ